MSIRGQILVEGHGEGEILKLEAPISFWGGVEPKTGRITDPRHPQHNENVAGKILVLSHSIGSSSGSSILLELMRRGLAPAGIILGEVDAILTLGAIVGREMGYAPVPIIRAEAQITGTGVSVALIDGSEIKLNQSSPN